MYYVEKLLAVIGLLGITSFSQGQNLIQNPSAEQSPTKNGWTAVSQGNNCYGGSRWRINGDQQGFPAAHHGSYIFFAGCDEAYGELYQDVDVSKSASSIDAGTQPYSFSGYLRVYDQNPCDTAQVIVEYRNASGAVLTTYNTGYTTDKFGWIQYSNNKIAPSGTRKIRIRLISRVGTGPSLDGYFDDLSLTADTPLPIDLISFKAERSTTGVSLTWVTASETNNDFFTIERSVDGVDWTLVKDIPGAGFSNVLLTYETKDDSQLKGVIYYRLKQTDFDLKYSYSDIVVVDLNSIVQNKLEMYPNPAIDFIKINGSGKRFESVRVFDALGHDVSRSVNVSGINGTDFKVDLTNLPKGVYFVQMGEKMGRFYKD